MEFITIIIVLAIVVLVLASFWKLYEKAGKPGWAAIIPIYSTLVMLEIIHKPWWWLILMFIPYIGFIWSIWAFVLFIKSYGKSTGYAIGAMFLPFIFLPMMAFDENVQYMLEEDEDYFNE